jgi:hypothetical protein
MDITSDPRRGSRLFTEDAFERPSDDPLLDAMFESGSEIWNMATEEATRPEVQGFAAIVDVTDAAVAQRAAPELVEEAEQITEDAAESVSVAVNSADNDREVSNPFKKPSVPRTLPSVSARQIRSKNGIPPTEGSLAKVLHPKTPWPIPEPETQLEAILVEPELVEPKLVEPELVAQELVEPELVAPELTSDDTFLADLDWDVESEEVELIVEEPPSKPRFMKKVLNRIAKAVPQRKLSKLEREYRKEDRRESRNKVLANIGLVAIAGLSLAVAVAVNHSDSQPAQDAVPPTPVTSIYSGHRTPTTQRGTVITVEQPSLQKIDKYATFFNLNYTDVDTAEEIYDLDKKWQDMEAWYANNQGGDLVKALQNFQTS